MILAWDRRIKLFDLLKDSQSVELRYGAFRALHAMNNNDPDLKHEVVGDHLNLYQLETNGTPFIHFSGRARSEIAIFGRQPELLTPVFLKAGPEILLIGGKSAPSLKVTRIALGRETQHQLSSLRIDDVIRRASRMGASYSGLFGMLSQAEQNHNLPGKLEMDALPDPSLLTNRLRKIASADAPPARLAMPNLFSWLEPNKTVESRTSARVGLGPVEDSKEPRKYLTNKKPSLLYRLLRRTAN